MQTNTMGFSVTLNNAIEELKGVKSVAEWNEVRSKYVKELTQQECAYLDSCGLIVEVLGSGK